MRMRQTRLQTAKDAAKIKRVPHKGHERHSKGFGRDPSGPPSVLRVRGLARRYCAGRTFTLVPGFSFLPPVMVTEPPVAPTTPSSSCGAAAAGVAPFAPAVTTDGSGVPGGMPAKVRGLTNLSKRGLFGWPGSV